MVGLRHRLAAGTFLNGLYPTVDAVQDQYQPGDTQRGKSYVTGIPKGPILNPLSIVFFFFYLGL